MKVGSLVVCVDDEALKCPDAKPIKKWRIYQVRSFFTSMDGNPTIRLDGIFNYIHPVSNREVGYQARRFRELDTPTSISIEEILEEPVYA